MEAIDNISLKSFIYLEIKKMIYKGQFPVGEKINKAELAKKFETSLTPINDALNRLVGESFLTFESRKGYFVKEISIEEMIDFFELRASLEGMALRLCAESLEDDMIDEIANVFPEFKFPLSEEDHIRYQNCDNTFHSLIVEYSENHYIKQIMNSLGVLAKSYQKGLIRQPEETYPEHLEMIEALKQRDGDKAQTLMNHHHLYTRRYLKQMLNDNIGL